MIGVILSIVTAIPLISPAISTAASAIRIASNNLPESPPAWPQTTTAERVIEPTTEKSIPPCWITRYWPTAAIARIAAKGSIKRIAEPFSGAALEQRADDDQRHQRDPDHRRLAIAAEPLEQRAPGHRRPLSRRHGGPSLSQVVHRRRSSEDPEHVRLPGGVDPEEGDRRVDLLDQRGAERARR